MSHAMEHHVRASAHRPAEIAEFQGMYGAYHVSETLLQKVWLRGEFDVGRACLHTGEPLRILHRGAWNRLAGPDFQGAKLELGDRVVTGDIEVHFHAAAWTQHGHHEDPAYENVVLHVVLFPPPSGGPPSRTRQGRIIPVLVLVDLLWHDLEEYASDEAVAALTGRDSFPVLEELLAMPTPAREAALAEAAIRRWREKEHFARRRVERLGWAEACHITTLEILGYRSNRVAMLHVGARFPWATWRREPPTFEEVAHVAAEWWTLRGVRPANQPRIRLAQYHKWMSRTPDWPERLRAWKLPGLVPKAVSLPAAVVRKQSKLAAWRNALAQELGGSDVGATRFDTWVVNMVLPFLGLAGDPAAEVLWRVWPPGDAPEPVLRAVRQLAVPGLPFLRTNGVVQGLLGLQLARALPAGLR